MTDKSVESTQCDDCGNMVSFHLRECHVCAADIGFPNVRQAELEQDELEKRYKSAIASLSARKVSKVASKFEKALTDDSYVVLATNINELIRLTNSDNLLYTTFANQVNGSMRIAEDNKWDRGRDAAESALFPRYWENIVFAAISLKPYGLSHYGKAHIALNSDLIRKRTSVFEENPFKFMQKHQVIAGQKPPEGYRATWGGRAKLAIAKLHSKISEKETLDEFQSVLISNGDDQDGDFVEAHIYGALHPRTFKSVRFLNLEARDQVLIKAHNKNFSELNIDVLLDEG